MVEIIDDYFFQVQETFKQISRESIVALINLLLDVNRRQRQIFVMGNGGSAATASHFACDLGKGVIVPGFPRFRVIALTDNVSIMTAWANDTAYEDIFAQQLAGLVRRGDLVIGISGSGNSPNVLNAIRLAQSRKAITVGLCGFEGGQLKGMVDLPLHVPSTSMEQVEDIHMILCHLVCTTLRGLLYKRRALRLALDTRLALEGEALQGLANRLISSLQVTLCSLALLDEARERAVIQVATSIRDLATIPAVGREIYLPSYPTLERMIEEGRPLLFRQHEPDSAVPADELGTLLADNVTSGILLPFGKNGEVAGLIAVGEMRAWERSPITSELLHRMEKLVEQWDGNGKEQPAALGEPLLVEEIA